MSNILVIHGPNLNLLGLREPQIYGNATLDEINNNLHQQAAKFNWDLTIKQHNSEGDFIDTIHAARDDNIAMMLINAGGFTHTSVAIRDAILAVAIPFIEVHLSNVFQREHFRHHSYLSDIAVGMINGFGPFVYQLALQAADNYLAQHHQPKETT